MVRVLARIGRESYCAYIYIHMPPHNAPATSDNSAHWRHCHAQLVAGGTVGRPDVAQGANSDGIGCAAGGCSPQHLSTCSACCNVSGTHSRTNSTS